MPLSHFRLFPAVRSGLGGAKDTELERIRLDTLVRLRWLAITGQVAGVLIVHFGLGFVTPLFWIAVVILMAASLNIFLTLRFPMTHRVAGRVASGILAFDILQLSSLLYLTGGLENPFSFLFLAPVMISAASLPPRVTLELGILAVISATVLTKFHWPLPWAQGQVFTLAPMYVAGIWFSILLGLAFTGVYAWRVAEEGRQLADALVATELVLMREQHLSQVDGLAAAAAHQLGTPLSTIAVVAAEMDHQVGADSPMKDDIHLLRGQAKRCRDILGQLRNLNDVDCPLGQASISQLVAELVEPHHEFGIEFVVSKQGTGPEPVCKRNPGMSYGIGNLIENAVDFAESRVTIAATWDAERVLLSIRDDGKGFAPEVLKRLGEPYLTTRHTNRTEKRGEGGGMGLGMFIAKTLLERSGARFHASNGIGSQHGAVIEIIWPRLAFESRLDLFKIRSIM